MAMGTKDQAAPVGHSLGPEDEGRRWRQLSAVDRRAWSASIAAAEAAQQDKQPLATAEQHRLLSAILSRFEDLHDLLVMLQWGPSLGDSVDWTTPSPPPGGAPTGGPPVGLWVMGDLLSASGEIQWPPAGRFVAA